MIVATVHAGENDQAVLTDRCALMHLLALLLTRCFAGVLFVHSKQYLMCVDLLTGRAQWRGTMPATVFGSNPTWDPFKNIVYIYQVRNRWKKSLVKHFNSSASHLQGDTLHTTLLAFHGVLAIVRALC